MFSSFVKTLPRAVWTEFAFCHITWCRSSILSTPLQIPTPLPKFRSVSSILLFALSMLPNASKSAFNVKLVPGITFSVELLRLLRHNHLCQWVPLRWAPPAAYIASKVAMPTFLQSVPYSIGPFTLSLNPTFQNSHFSFLCWKFICVGQFPFSVTHFCKMSPEFVLRRQGGNTTAHCDVCMWHDIQTSWAVTHWQTLKEASWTVVTGHNKHVI